MNRQSKTDFIDTFHQSIKDTSLVVLASYTGTKVNQSNLLRRRLDQAGIRLRVVKNTLAKRALAGTPLENLASQFTGMTAVMYVKDDAIAGARLVREALQGLDTLAIKAGWFDGEVFEGKNILGVADLPGREELLSTLLCTIQEPVRQVMAVIEGPARDLAYLLKNREDQLGEDQSE